LWLIAGPNGAGKTTYARSFSSEIEELVRPDLLAIQLSPENPERAALKAGRLAIDRIKSLLQKKQSFAVETTLRTLSSGRGEERQIRRLERRNRVYRAQDPNDRYRACTAAQADRRA
jgi:predicted ABC-type ATPase